MDKKKQYKSEAYAAVHETMDAVHQIGAIDKKTMRDFDEMCLEPVSELAAAEIRKLREREHVSQPIFAMYLNVSRNLVSDWERGVKKPGGPALRLLSIVQNQGLDALVAAKKKGHSRSSCGSSPSAGRAGEPHPAHG